MRRRPEALQEEFAKQGVLFQYTGSIEDIPTYNKEFYSVGLPFYIRNYSREWERFEKEQKPSNPPTLDESTIRHFSLRWTVNFIRAWNSRKIRLLRAPHTPISTRPMLFLGAAPDLEENLTTIQQNSENFILVASDTASGYLLRSEVLPDAVLSVDPGRGTLYHLRECIDRKIPILTWMGGVDFSFLGQDYPLYYFLTTHPLDQFVGQYLGWGEDCLLPNPSRNLAGMAKSLAKFWGLKTFLYTGISFVSKGPQTHVRGTGYESYYLPKLHRRKSLEASYPRKTYGKSLSAKNSLAIQAIFSSSEDSKLTTQTLAEWVKATSFNRKGFAKEKPFHPPYEEKNLTCLFPLLPRIPPNTPGIHDPTLRRYLSRRLP